jgi:hypothetical protein
LGKRNNRISKIQEKYSRKKFETELKKVSDWSGMKQIVSNQVSKKDGLIDLLEIISNVNKYKYRDILETLERKITDNIFSMNDDEQKEIIEYLEVREYNFHYNDDGLEEIDLYNEFITSHHSINQWVEFILAIIPEGRFDRKKLEIFYIIFFQLIAAILMI